MLGTGPQAEAELWDVPWLCGPLGLTCPHLQEVTMVPCVQKGLWMLALPEDLLWTRANTTCCWLWLI